MFRTLSLVVRGMLTDLASFRADKQTLRGNSAKRPTNDFFAELDELEGVSSESS